MSGGVKLAGGLFGAVGAKQSADASASGMQSQADALKEQSRQVLRDSRRQADIFERESEVALGDQVSSFAKAGVDMSGSPLMVLAASERDVKNNVSDILVQGERRRASLLAAGRAAGKQAKSARRAGDFAAVGSILGGVGEFL